MARWIDGETYGIYELAADWRDRCLLGDDGLWSEEGTWSAGNVEALDELFNGNELRGEGDFGDKFDAQLEDAEPAVRRVAAEILAVHFLFTVRVGKQQKLAVVERVLHPLGEAVPDEHPLRRAFDGGIGGPGVGFNTRRDLQLGFLIDFCARAKRQSQEERSSMLASATETKKFADQATQRRWIREMRQILLHLLHPDQFERMSSAGHKRLICQAFAEFVEDEQVEDDDDRLLVIRDKLQQLEISGDWPEGYLDFYWGPLEGIWRTAGSEEEDDGADADRDGAAGGVTLVEALEWRKQAILYGPPGTSKTFRVDALARLLVRRAALRSWGAKTYFSSRERVETLAIGRRTWVQLHPGYGYEEFVRGMRIVGGDTRYEPGLLLRLIEDLSLEAEAESDLAELPWVLVLDEINRTDLSQMLGEAFSLLEPDKRGQVATLPGFEGGEETTLEVPANLFIVGTMNLIDQSVEQVDFALRRRFHWHPCGFSRNLLIEIVNRRLKELGTPAKHRHRDALQLQITEFAGRAAEINRRIAELDELGEEYEIGHTIFADLARPLDALIRSFSNVRDYYLWDRYGPTSAVTDLWKFALRPLLDQYLGSLPATERKRLVEDLQNILLAAP